MSLQSLQSLQKWKTRNSRHLVEDRWLKLRADSCLTAEGRSIEPFYVLEYPHWVNCFVLDDQQNALMLNHYRHGVDEILVELVSGAIEASDSSPEAAMRRELEEELGYTDGVLQCLGESYPNPANQSNKVYSFIAVGGSCSQVQKLEEGETLHALKIPLRELESQVISGKYNRNFQSMHLVTMLWALEYLKAIQ